LRIATSAAFYTAVFFVAISVLATFLAPWFYENFFEVASRIVAIILALMLSQKRTAEVRLLKNPEAVPFLSTIFFYGITLLLVYLGQMWYVIFNIIFVPATSLISQIEFILGISSFAGVDIVSAFLAGHIPYIVYFFALKLAVRRVLLDSTVK
jgi:hypothetical protein